MSKVVETYMQDGTINYKVDEFCKWGKKFTDCGRKVLKDLDSKFCPYCGKRRL